LLAATLSKHPSSRCSGEYHANPKCQGLAGEHTKPVGPTVILDGALANRRSNLAGRLSYTKSSAAGLSDSIPASDLLLWDHVGGCFPIVQALRVDAVGDSGQIYGGRAFRDCMTAASVHHVPVILVSRGMHYATDDGVTLDALGPEEPLLADGTNDVNENSVVVRLTYRCTACARPFRMLFMGDAGAQSEAKMLAAGADLEADVLKVGHDGSAYSSTHAFITATHPGYALISVGRHNLFGHPAQTTLTTLRQVGATVYRTDRCGAISIEAGPAIAITPMVSCR